MSKCLLILNLNGFQTEMNNLRPGTYQYEYSTRCSQICGAGVYLLGFEFDGTACFRKGAFAGPDAFRKVSEGVESYTPYLDIDLEDFSSEKIFDLGNLNLQKDLSVTETFLDGVSKFEQLTTAHHFKKNEINLITLGGEHSISFAPIKKYLNNFSDLVLIHLDAHADLRDGYLGNPYSHASIMRRAVDLFGPHHQLIQYGIRSGTKEEYTWMEKNKTLCYSQNEFLERVLSIASERPIYLSLDLDYFDPSFMPGTGTPEAGGEDFHSFVSLIKILTLKNIVGADIVELAPGIDLTENSSIFATKVLRELIACLLSGKK